MFIFISVQLVLYGTFLYLDLTDGSILISNLIKFSTVILCLLYVLFAKSEQGGTQLNLLRLALLFTVVSDLFILILDYYFYGVLTFIIAQQIYGIRLSYFYLRKNGSAWLRDLSASFFILAGFQVMTSAVLILLLTWLGVRTDRLLIASVFYFISILTNVVRSIITTVRYPGIAGIRIFTAGIILFLFCDINVGLFNLSGFLDVGEGLFKTVYAAASILMWAFYAPSQVLISLSSDINRQIQQK